MGNPTARGLAGDTQVNGVPVSDVVFGCLSLHVTDDAFGILDAAWEGGITTFDCAAIYGAGECERVLGRWLAARGYVGRAVIITKGGCGDQSTLWAPNLARASIEAELDASRARLGVDTIDVYMLHRDDPDIAVATIAGLMHDLIARGAIRTWAVSNWSVPRLREMVEFCTAGGMPPPLCNSVQASLAEPRHDVWPGTTRLLPGDVDWYAAAGMPVLAWECLGKGFLSGGWDIDDMTRRAAREPRPGVYDGDWRKWRLASAYITPENLARRERVAELARRLGIPPAAVALAYLQAQPYQCWTAVGTTNRHHLREALQCTGVSLTPRQCAWLRGGAEAGA